MSESAAAERRDVSIRGVIFDFDGTLTDGGTLDFTAIRRDLGIGHNEGILDYIDSLPAGTARSEAENLLLSREEEAAGASFPREGAEALVLELRAQGIPTAILTRNTRRSLLRSFENFSHLSPAVFDPIITRDDSHAYKPSPEGVHAVSRFWGVPEEAIVVVGDYRDDISAGLAAGAHTVYLAPLRADTGRAEDVRAHYNVRSITELRVYLLDILAIQPGKVPGDLLAELLPDLPGAPSVLLGPGVGIDSALVAAPDEELIAVTSDPVTFPTADPIHYVTTIATNDLVTSGARPRWCTVTLLFPVGTTRREVRSRLQEQRRAAEAEGIAVVGGHSEITPAVTRLVLNMTVFGTLPREKLRMPGETDEEAELLLVGSAGMEGTSILATECEETLRAAGLSAATLAEGRRMAGSLSVRPAAVILAEAAGLLWMHDVTEGGVATALRELAGVLGRDLEIDVSSIPVARPTEEICTALGLDPLGLIGSGALLALVKSREGNAVVDSLADAGIAATVIGTAPADGKASTAGGRAELRSSDEERTIPVFHRDELARVL